MHPTIQKILMVRDRDLRRWGRPTAILMFLLSIVCLVSALVLRRIVYEKIDPIIHKVTAKEVNILGRFHIHYHRHHLACIRCRGKASSHRNREWRASIIGRQRGDVAACLVVGAFKGLVEGECAALAVAGLGGGGLGGFVGGGIGGEALLGFVDEVAGLVEVDVIRGGGAVQIGAGDGAVEDVEVLRGIG